MPTGVRTSRPASGGSSPWRSRAVAVGVAVLATAMLWGVAKALGIDLKVDPHNGQPAGAIGLDAVAGFTLLFSLLGWGVLALLERFTRRAATIWTVLAVAVLAISFVPVAFVGATAGTKILLSLMHFAVASVLIPLLRRGTPRGTS